MRTCKNSLKYNLVFEYDEFFLCDTYIIYDFI